MLKNLLLLTGFSTFAVIVIVAFNIYHNYTQSSLSDTTQTRIIPIPPTFDKETITQLKERDPISVSLSGKTEVQSEDTKDSPSTTISVTPSATTSGTLISNL